MSLRLQRNANLYLPCLSHIHFSFNLLKIPINSRSLARVWPAGIFSFSVLRPTRALAFRNEGMPRLKTGTDLLPKIN